MKNKENSRVPKALFNSRALFNPYQYLPFDKVMDYVYDEQGGKGKYEFNGNNILIQDEVGVGKTFEVGIILRELLFNNPGLKVCILCPVKLCENWQVELRTNFGISPTNYSEDNIMGNVMSIIPYSFFSAKRTKGMKLREEIEIEKELRKSMGEEIDEDKLKQIHSYDVLILDEVHYVRNQGKLWKYISKLIDREEPDSNTKKLRIFMTGTPIFNSENDYVHIIELLSQNGKNYEITQTLQAEANCYDYTLDIQLGGIDGNGKPGIEIKPSKLEKKIIDEVDKTIIKLKNDEGEFDEEEYDDNEGEFDDDSENIIERAKYGKQTGYLKRISASSIYSLKEYVIGKTNSDKAREIFESDSKELQELLTKWSPKEDSKLKALKELLKYLQDNEVDRKKTFKVIIFSWSIKTCNYLKEQLEEKYHVYTIIGKTNANKVSEYKRAFENDAQPAILICSDAAKEGHNLQFCHFLIHYDFPYSPAVISQRNGRIYRKGQSDKPKVFYLPMKSGYDRRLFGEIIVKKCQIIRNKVSGLNILPKDSKVIQVGATGEFIKDYFGQKRTQNKDDIEIAKMFLRKFFLEKIRNENKEVEARWKMPKAENLYRLIEEKLYEKIEEYKDEELNRIINEWSIKGYEKLETEEGTEEKLEEILEKVLEEEPVIEQAIVIFYLSCLIENDGGEELQNIYQEKYNKEIEKIIEKFFGKEIDEKDKKNILIEFIKCCNDYVGTTNTRYGHHMMLKDMNLTEEKDEELLKELGLSKEEYKNILDLSMETYKEQFKLLREWEKKECQN